MMITTYQLYLSLFLNIRFIEKLCQMTKQNKQKKKRERSRSRKIPFHQSEIALQDHEIVHECHHILSQGFSQAAKQGRKIVSSQQVL